MSTKKALITGITGQDGADLAAMAGDAASVQGGSAEGLSFRAKAPRGVRSTKRVVMLASTVARAAAL